MTKVFQEQQIVYETILAQVYSLQRRSVPGEEGVRYAIVNTADLKALQEAATKEKATETTQLVERMIARASGQRGRRGG